MALPQPSPAKKAPAKKAPAKKAPAKKAPAKKGTTKKAPAKKAPAKKKQPLGESQANEQPMEEDTAFQEFAQSPVAKGKPKKTVEEMYQKKTQLEHILLRPDTVCLAAGACALLPSLPRTGLATSGACSAFLGPG
jgi:hypothetical protein